MLGKQNILGNLRFERIDTYTFPVTVKGEEIGDAKIIFINGEFSQAIYPMRGNYSRDEWRVLVAIESAISEIEEDYHKSCGDKTCLEEDTYDNT